MPQTQFRHLGTLCLVAPPNTSQGILLICVLLPLYLLMTANHSGGMAQTSGAAVLAGATGLFTGTGMAGRKMINELPPPAAHLRNLILVGIGATAQGPHPMHTSL